MSVSGQEEPRNIHLLIPATHADDQLCKGLLSASLLGYPAPVLINWNKSFTDEVLAEGMDFRPGSHLAKPRGLYNYLQNFDNSAANDLVIVVDGLDAWFQLPPSVYLDRFGLISRRADDRVEQEVGPWAVETYNIHNKVVFSSTKNCWPLEFNKPGAFAIPESPQGPGFYGKDTDKVIESKDPDQWGGFRNFRNRFINSGGITGSLEGVRDLCDRTTEYSTMPEHDYHGSDQGIMADIFGEQEMWRDLVTSGSPGNPPNVDLYKAFELHEEKRYEFGISLDYEELLVLSTGEHGNQTAWIRYNDRKEIAKLSKADGYAHPYVASLPADLGRAEAPFPADHILHKIRTWADIPLFTNIRTGYTPAVVHHNEWAHEAKTKFGATWPQMWFQPFAQKLYDRIISNGPVQMTVRQADGALYEWISAGGIVRTDSGQEFRYSDLCGDWWDQVFVGQQDVIALR